MPKLDGYTPAGMATSNLIEKGLYLFRLNKVEYHPAKEADPSKPKSDENKDKSAWLNVDLVVIEEDSEYLGRHVFDYVSLAQGDDWKMRQLCEALGKPDDWTVDTDEMVDGEVYGVVGVSAGKKGYPDKNQIRKYMNPDSPDLGEAQAQASK